jgi:FAD/FMN-containing dehydrogenase
MPAPPQAFFDALDAVLPKGTVSRDPNDLAEYGRDWTRVFEPAPCAVALPRTTYEVGRIVEVCGQHEVAIVPSGGRTGLAGGAMACNGELVVSLTRMRAIRPVDAVGATVRVQAGAITQAVHEHCGEHGLTWPVDFASKGSSTVGGNIATNAGGVKVIRYGLTRQWVLGLEVVVASGETLELGGALEKNNTGVDLRQLFIGSEGTLGIVTEATLKLVRLPGKLDVLLFAVPDLAGVLRLFRETRAAPLTLAAYEMFTAECLARVVKHRKLRPPLESPSPYYVLVELEDASREAIETWVQSLFDREIVQDGVLAQTMAEARDLWALREGISESLSATGLPHKNDIALPIAALEAFSAELGDVFARRYPGWEVCVFGHVGDGNLHVNVMKPDGMEKAAFLDRTHEADRDLFDLVKKHAGSISAEHGIGLLKKAWLPWTRSEADRALMRAIKKALDPAGIFNPGKILD